MRCLDVEILESRIEIVFPSLHWHWARALSLRAQKAPGKTERMMSWHFRVTDLRFLQRFWLVDMCLFLHHASPVQLGMNALDAKHVYNNLSQQACTILFIRRKDSKRNISTWNFLEFWVKEHSTNLERSNFKAIVEFPVTNLRKENH